MKTKYILEVFKKHSANKNQRYFLYRFPLVDWNRDIILYTNSKSKLIMTMDVLGIRHDMKFLKFNRCDGTNTNQIPYAMFSNFN